MYLWVNNVSMCLHVTGHLWECVTVWYVYVQIFVHICICSHVIVCFAECVSIYEHVSLCMNMPIVATHLL